MFKLLIVDDEALLRRGIRTLIDFEALNITTVLEAANGVDALKIFKAESPELILLDINLPHITGLELAEQFKTFNPYCSIAMLTGYDYFDYMQKALRLGVDDYILKPLTAKEIFEVLTRLIHNFEQTKRLREVDAVVSNLSTESAPLPELLKPLEISLKETIDQHLFESDFSLSKLSDLLGYNSSYISSLAKTTLGMTFQDYVLSHRLERAKLLLLTTSLKNYEISEKVGFTDVNYFNTRFKIAFGESPKQYAKRNGQI